MLVEHKFRENRVTSSFQKGRESENVSAGRPGCYNFGANVNVSIFESSILLFFGLAMQPKLSLSWIVLFFLLALGSSLFCGSFACAGESHTGIVVVGPSVGRLAWQANAGKQVQEKTESTATQKTPKLTGEIDKWNGFDRHRFKFQNRAAYIVKPQHAAPGNPWVWRARFPGFHTQADVILLRRGFHIAFLDTNGLLGSAAAMEDWDKFYKHATELGLAKRVALEGVSRGGLFVYGFASRWPERVSCLYADTPVCDVRSWPGGFGNGKGAPSEWKACLQHYQLTEATAKEFKGSPIDQLQRIAEAKLPILHIVSLSDTIVPPDENTFVMRNRLHALGWKMDVIEVDEGTEKSSGHHFTHPDPVRVADFIERHASVVPARDREDYFVRRGALGRSRRVFEETGKGRVAFLGGSITHNPGWRDKTMAYLESRFPKTKFEFINAGIPSTGSVPGAFRLENDVLSKGKIDLLFEEASVNDVSNGRTRAQMTRGMEGIVRHALRSNPQMDVVVMHFACPVHTKDYRSGKTPMTIAQHEAVARHYDVTSLDLAREVQQRMDADQFDWEKDFVNLHPSNYGQRLYAASIRRMLSRGWDHITVEEMSLRREVPKPIDPFCYDHGRFVPLSKASKLKGFQLTKNTDPRAEGVGGGVRAGFYNVPMLVGSTGDSMELEFQGRGVAMFVAAGPDAAKIEYLIDGGDAKSLELTTRWSRGLHLPWVYVLADELDASVNHRLVIRVAETDTHKKTGVCRIVRLLVNE